jgi:anti-anti-sigma factor
VPPTDRPLIDVSSLAPFVVVISAREAAVAVSLYGRLDATTVPEARDAVRRMDLSPGRLCLLDLQALSGIDAAGVDLVIGLGLQARRRGWTLAVVRRPDGPVCRELASRRLAEHVIVVDAPPLRRARAKVSRRPALQVVRAES